MKNKYEEYHQDILKLIAYVEYVYNTIPENNKPYDFYKLDEEYKNGLYSTLIQSMQYMTNYLNYTTKEILEYRNKWYVIFPGFKQYVESKLQ